MANVASIWAPFASDKYKQASPNLNSPAFAQALWHGMPNEHPIRANVWRHARELLGAESWQLPRPSQKTQQNVTDKIRMELNSEGCFASIGRSVDAAAVEHILLQHATKICLDDYMPGSAQLAALMLIVFDGDSNAALNALTTLSYRLHLYYCNSHVQLRRDCLVLAELIVADLPALADHFNSLAFDVVDLTDLICIWATPVFIYLFPRAFVLHMLDLIFVLGPVIILPVMYGFFKFFANDLSVLHTLDSVFDFLNTVPGTLTHADLTSIFRAASEMASQMDRLSKLRSEKDWIKTADHEGIPTFLPGLFQASTFSSPPSNSLVRFLSSKFESQASNDSGAPPNLVLRARSGSLEYLDGADRAAVKEDEHAKLIAAENLIRTQNAKIERLEKQVLILEAKAMIPSVTSTARGHSPDNSGVKSALVKELQSKQSCTADLHEPSVSSVAIHVDASGQERFRSFSFSEMNEIYSRIHSLIDFPCVYMEGYLLKLSRAGLFGRQVLNQRWFVLKGRYLTYYKSAEHSKPQKDRCMNLKGCSVMAVDDHPKGDFSFVISCRNEQYILFASCAEDRARWISAIDASIKS